MAHYLRSSPDFNPARSVKITATETVDKYTVYDIALSLGAYHWIVKHRYNEFRDLHDKLVARYKIEKTLLPPKKLFGNSSESFIRKRQGELELYLQTLLYKLSPLPDELAFFLHFDKYEIHGITHVLAEELYHQGDLILQSGEPFSLTPLQLYAVTKRLKLPEPTCVTGDAKKDIGHILDFITSVKHIKIHGQHCQLGTSNILMNDLGYELNMFKSLEVLELVVCNPTKMTSTEGIKKTVKELKVFNTVSKLKDILLVDVEFGQWLGVQEEAVLVPVWTSLIKADFSYNQLETIDDSVKLMPKVKELDLSHNALTDLCHLEHLSCLTHLDISSNEIHNLQALHTKLGNITMLCLANNKLESLQGFSKLYSLEQLDISHNEISQVLEIQHISSLPCLESLDLTGNPVTIVLDYRTKVLELFRDRAKEVALDGMKPSQKELDTVAILLALQKSKQTKEKTKKHRKAREVTIVDPSSDSSTSLSTSHEQSKIRGHQFRSQGNDLDSSDHSYSSSVDYRQASASARLRDQSAGDGNSSSDTDKDCLLSSRHQCTDDQSCCQTGCQISFRDNIVHTMNEANADSGANSKASYRPHGPDLTTEVDVQPKLGYQHHVDWSRLESHITHAGTLLPETLPNRNDATFVSHVQELLPSTSSLSRRSRTREDAQEQQEEKIMHVMWCTVLCYTEPTSEIMACICISTENLHLLEVKSLRGGNGMPCLVHMHCIPLINLEQIVLGYQRQYLRIEEALVGPQGTYVLLTGSMAKTDLFLDSLKLAYRRAISDIDQYEDPHIMANCQTETNLLLTLSKFEQMTKPEDITVSLYMLVNAVDYTQPGSPFVTHSLVMTTSHLYLLKEDFVMWPQATFAIGITSRSQFEVVCAFPIMGKITGIQMYDSDTYSPDKDMSLAQTFSAINTCAMVVPNFIGFGVKLTFDLGSLGQQSVDIRVSTSGMRDRFLATLTQLRKDHSEKTSSPSKASRTRIRLKEADADSLSTNSGGSNHGTWSAHQRHAVGSKHRHKPKGHEARKPERTSGRRPDLLPELNKNSMVLSLEDSMNVATKRNVALSQMAEDCDSYPDIESSDDMASHIGLQLREGPVGQSANSEESSSSEEFVSGAGAASVKQGLPGHRNISKQPVAADVPSHDNSEESPTTDSQGYCRVSDGMLDIIQQPHSDANILSSYDKPYKEKQDSQSDDETNDEGHASEERETETDDQSAGSSEGHSDQRDAPSGRQITEPVPSTPAILKSQLTLDVQYPSMALLSHLTECNEQVQMLQPLPDVLRNVAAMEGDELLNFFHGSVARIGHDTEELRHVLWTPVLPYTKPQREVITCVMVSTKAVYFLSDHDPQDQVVRLKEWKSHSRNRSDSYRLLRGKDASCLADMHSSSGVLHQCRHVNRTGTSTPKTYAVLPLRELKDVTIGLFDQSFRLVGPAAELTFTCMTRDNRLTGDFIRNLMSVLSVIKPTPSPEYGGSQLDAEHDFYSKFNTYSRLESHEYKHQSRVKFVYPNEDLVNELLYVVSTSEPDRCAEVLHLLMYLTVFLKSPPSGSADRRTPTDDDDLEQREAADVPGAKQPGRAISLILSEHYLTLCLEDHVHYPIPDFAFGPPAFPRLRILDNWPLKHLKRIALSASDAHLMTLVFSDEKEIIVNPEFDHYTPYGGRVRRHVVRIPEVRIVTVVQNPTHKDKFISLLKQHWAEIQGTETELDVLYEPNSD